MGIIAFPWSLDCEAPHARASASTWKISDHLLHCRHHRIEGLSCIVMQSPLEEDLKWAMSIVRCTHWNPRIVYSFVEPYMIFIVAKGLKAQLVSQCCQPHNCTSCVSPLLWSLNSPKRGFSALAHEPFGGSGARIPGVIFIELVSGMVTPMSEAINDMQRLGK